MSWRFSNNTLDPAAANNAVSVIAKITKPWGLKGLLKALPFMDNPPVLSHGQEILLTFLNGSTEKKKVRSVARHGKFLVFAFHDVDTHEKAAELRDALIALDNIELPPLAEGEYYHHQIIGLSVVTEDGSVVGNVRDILSTGNNDVYVVQNKNGEYLIPAIKDIISSIDLSKKVITINAIEGLLG